MKIMTGKAGTPHVAAQQFRQFVEGTVGQESYILTSGDLLEPELVSNNSLKIRSGIMSHHGNLSTVDLGTYDTVTIRNGSQGMKRIDLVVNRYTKNKETGIEKNEWIVIMGNPTSGSPSVPTYTQGNLQEGDLVDDCPVFEVHLNGINVTEVKKLLKVMPSIPTINKDLSELRDKHKSQNKFAASEIDTGETWIDGKKIYRRTYITTDPVSPSNTLTIPISLTGIADTLWIDQQNSFIRSKGGEQVYPLPLPRYSGSNNYVGVWINTAGIRLFSDSSWNQNWEKCITIKYTKK
ncbi:MAG: hypothetical protein SOZ15_05820 [[Ruminococcus] torques]|uniref:hypothetical protein n=1 Tax=[Ruminococcus] torques TaxID=33039 RepID=UPI0024327C54|nr:hypothetical protein [[Ruminococcus] torques]MCI7673676.1 hypothetical protein [[Ruminococcus] torques]MDY3952823.1 hypothetical protein [[Ruminococcus] torques]